MPLTRAWCLWCGPRGSAAPSTTRCEELAFLSCTRGARCCTGCVPALLSPCPPPAVLPPSCTLTGPTFRMQRELLCATEGAEAGVRLDVTLSPDQEEAFLRALVEDFGSVKARPRGVCER